MINTTTRVSLALICASATTGCGQTLEQRFQAMCEEQRATDPETWSHSEGMCKNGQVVPDDIKEQAIQGWDRMKELKADVSRDAKK